jgi:hypothetical protein
VWARHFELAGERRDAPAGTFVRVAPRVARTAFARDAGTTVRDAPAAFITVEGIVLCQAAKGGAVSKSAAKWPVPMWRPLRSAIVAASAMPLPRRPAPPSGPSGIAILGGNVS